MYEHIRKIYEPCIPLNLNLHVLVLLLYFTGYQVGKHAYEVKRRKHYLHTIKLHKLLFDSIHPI